MFFYYPPNQQFMYEEELLRHSKKNKLQLTRAYVPDQPYIGIFPLHEGLKKGTIFPNLAIPYKIKSKE